MTYTTHFNNRKTPQSSPIYGKPMVKNNAGGYTFEVSPMNRLERFLVLGSVGGSYYASEQKLTKENAEDIINLILSEDGVNVVEKIVEFIELNRIPKRNTAFFVLALCATYGNEIVKLQSYNAIEKICKTSTDLFTFVGYVKDLRGWSRGLRSGVAAYYTNKSTDAIGYQMVKYRQRNGWEHKDIIRLSHPKPKSKHMENIFAYAVGKEYEAKLLPDIVTGFEKAIKEENPKNIVRLIEEYRLTWEMIPTKFLKSKEVWNALLQTMPMTAMVRNLNKFAAYGVTDSNLDSATKFIVNKLTSREEVEKGKLHPFNLLLAQVAYSKGVGRDSSGLRWRPVVNIERALETAFELSFGNIETTGKNFYCAVDGSGSMSSYTIANTEVTCMQAATALAMVRARTETSEFRVFDNSVPLSVNINPNDSFEAVFKKLSNVWTGGATDCAQPMIDALRRKLDVDVFEITTDNETYFGSIHPIQALKEYNQRMGKNAKLVVTGMVANKFTIAEPNNPNMLDVVGFDSAAPQIITDFVNDAW